MGIGRLGEPAVSDRRTGHGDRRVRAAATPSSTCRSSTAWSRSPNDGQAGDRRGARRAGRARASTRSRRAERSRERLSQIDVADLHDAVVLLEGDPALLHLGDDQFVERLQSYLELAPALRERVPDIDYVDLRFDERVYVRPRGEPGTVGRRARPADGDAAPHLKGEPVARKERYLVGLDVGTSKVTAVVGEMTRRRRARHHRASALAESRGHPARRRRQPRGGGRLDQEGDRRSRADGRRRDRLGAPRRCRARTSRASTAAAWSRSPARTARSRARTCGARSTRRRRWRCRPAARSCTCCRRTSSSTSRTASARRSGMTGARLEVNVHIVTGSAVVDAEHRRVREPRRRRRSLDTVLEQLAASEAVLTAGREGARRRARRHRRRHHRHRDLRARQPVAHRRRRRRRRSLHQRHRRRPAHADPRRGEDQAASAAARCRRWSTRTRRWKWRASAAASRA